MSCIALFSKPPVTGKTKSRLAADIGAGPAAELARAMLLDTCAAVSASSAATRQLWFPPDASAREFATIVPGCFTRHPQQGDDLGARIGFALRQWLTAGAGQRILVIGADCVTHSADALNRALQALNECEVVIQPAADGGYVLIGLSRWLPALFRGISWGTDRVMEETRAVVRSETISCLELEPAFDVDDIGDIRRILSFPYIDGRPHTSDWLNRYGWAPGDSAGRAGR